MKVSDIYHHLKDLKIVKETIEEGEDDRGFVKGRRKGRRKEMMRKEPK